MQQGPAYYISARTLVAGHEAYSALVRAIGSEFKGKISLVIYAAGIGLAFVHPALGIAMDVVVATMWLIPDRRIE